MWTVIQTKKMLKDIRGWEHNNYILSVLTCFSGFTVYLFDENKTKTIQKTIQKPLSKLLDNNLVT